MRLLPLLFVALACLGAPAGAEVRVTDVSGREVVIADSRARAYCGLPAWPAVEGRGQWVHSARALASVTGISRRVAGGPPGSVLQPSILAGVFEVPLRLIAEEGAARPVLVADGRPPIVAIR